MAPPPPRRAGTSQLQRVSPPARRASVLDAFGFQPRHTPSVPMTTAVTKRCRVSLSHVPCRSRRPGSRRLRAGHHLANTRAPARLLHRGQTSPAFDVVQEAFDTSTTTTELPSFPERLPGPHLTHLVRLFPIVHHDGLRPTQHWVVCRLPPQGDARGPSILHLLHSIAQKNLLHPVPPMHS